MWFFPDPLYSKDALFVDVSKYVVVLLHVLTSTLGENLAEQSKVILRLAGFYFRGGTTRSKEGTGSVCI